MNVPNAKRRIEEKQDALRDYLTKVAGGYVKTSEVEEITRLATLALQADHAEMKALLETLVDYEGVRGAAPSVTQRARAFLARQETDR